METNRGGLSQVWHYINDYCNIHKAWVVVLAVYPMMASGGRGGEVVVLLYLCGIFMSLCVVLFAKNMRFNEFHECI